MPKKIESEHDMGHPVVSFSLMGGVMWVCAGWFAGGWPITNPTLGLTSGKTSALFLVLGLVCYFRAFYTFRKDFLPTPLD